MRATLLSLLMSVTIASEIVLKPSQTFSKQIGVIWIQGALIENKAYQNIAMDFINEAAKS